MIRPTNRHGFVSIIVIFIAIAVLVGSGILYYVKNKSAQLSPGIQNSTQTPPVVSATTTTVNNPPQENTQDFYDKNSWQLMKSAESDFGEIKAKLLLLKSVKATGESGVGDPLYDVNLLVVRDGKVIYDYTKSGVKPSQYPGVNPTEFYVDDALKILDVTNDGIPEIIFHSGFEGASDWTTLEHILQYTSSANSFVDVNIGEFYNSLNHGLAWFNNVPVVAKLASTETCHSCGGVFEYDIYRWSQTTFVISKIIKGSKSYGDASSALEGDIDLIRSGISSPGLEPSSSGSLIMVLGDECDKATAGKWPPDESATIVKSHYGLHRKIS